MLWENVCENILYLQLGLRLVVSIAVASAAAGAVVVVADVVTVTLFRCYAQEFIKGVAHYAVSPCEAPIEEGAWHSPAIRKR